MKRGLAGLLLVLCMALTACRFPQSNTGEDVSDNTEEIVSSETEKTVYEEFYGKEFNDHPDEDEFSEPVISDVGEDETGEETDPEDNEEEYIDLPTVYVEPVYNVGHTNLKVPTWIEHYDGLYFIVDCYNDQILFSDSLNKELYEWQVFDPNGGGDDPVIGDINADGRCDQTDVTLLRDWLIAEPDVQQLADWEAGDLTGDEMLSGADLTLLKHYLLTQ